MGSQVAVAEVAVVPTFKGFRTMVTKETDGSAKAGAQGFTRAFASTGADSGKQVGTGFKKAFEQSANGVSDKVVKALEGDVAKASRALSTARLKEQDAIGKVRVAQAQLNEANEKYSSDSSQAIRAQERLATASRQLSTAHEGTERATDDLKRSQTELARAADHAGDELAEAGDRGVSGFRSNVVGGVKGFAAPLIGAFAALGIGNIVANAFSDAKDFFLGSIDLASDLNESINAVEVSYGDVADEVLKLGENSAQAFGLSKSDLNGYATQFSAFVKTIAGDGGDVVGTLEALVGRGTDFASVFNVDVSEALSLFQSGLAGETEPLRRYGIDLSAATVEAYALAHGIGDGTSELTEAQKQQARYGSLLEQTNAVQGDFVKTSDELANKNRINAAEWENVRAKIGDAFLPVASELADILSDDVIPVIAELAEEYGPELADAFSDILPELAELAKELLPLLPDLFDAIIATLPSVISLLQFLAPIFVSLAEDNGTWTTILQGMLDLMSGTSSPQEFIDKVLAMGGPLAEVLQGAYNLGLGIHDLLQGIINFSIMAPLYWDVFKTAVKVKIDEVINFIKDLPSRALAALGDLTDDLVQSGRDLMGGFIRGITSAPIGPAVSGALKEVQAYFPHSPAKKGPFSGSGWTELRRSGEAFWDQWVGGMGGGEGLPFPSFGSGGAFPSGAGAAPAGSAAIYVQNPFTGEYLLATVDQRAAAQAAARGKTLSAELRARRRADG